MTTAEAELEQEASAGAKLKADGEQVTVEDRTITVRFGMAGLLLLEDTFGSMAEVERVLTGMGGEAKVFGPLLDLIAAGVAHAGITRQELIEQELVTPANMAEWSLATGRAFRQAFPDVKVGGRGNGAGPARSRGASGTTSAPSRSGAAKKRSGR